MDGDDPIGQELAELPLRPAADDEARDQMEVCARVDVVRDAGRDDRQDRGGALATDVEPGEQPVLAADDQPPQLALATIVGGVDVAVVEEQQEPLPLAVQVAERAAERCLGRNGRPLVVDPDPQVVEDRAGFDLATQLPLVGGVAGELRRALDGEDARRSCAGPRARSDRRRVRRRRAGAGRGSSSPGACRRRARGTWSRWCRRTARCARDRRRGSGARCRSRPTASRRRSPSARWSTPTSRRCGCRRRCRGRGSGCRSRRCRAGPDRGSSPRSAWRSARADRCARRRCARASAARPRRPAGRSACTVARSACARGTCRRSPRRSACRRACRARRSRAASAPRRSCRRSGRPPSRRGGPRR